MRRTTKAGVLVETILILAGLALMGKAFMAGTSTYKFIGSSEMADGTISAVQDKGFTLVTQFTLASGTAEIFSQSGLFFSRQEAGQHIEVIYDPNDPAHAMVKRFGALWFAALVSGVPGFILLLLGFRLRSERNV